MAAIVYRNICANWVSHTGWKTPLRVKNDRTELQWDIQIQTDKQAMANQPDIGVQKQDKKAVLIGVLFLSNLNIKKEHEKLDKYQDLRGNK